MNPVQLTLVTPINRPFSGDAPITGVTITVCDLDPVAGTITMIGSPTPSQGPGNNHRVTITLASLGLSAGVINALPGALKAALGTALGVSFQ